MSARVREPQTRHPGRTNNYNRLQRGGRSRRTATGRSPCSVAPRPRSAQPREHPGNAGPFGRLCARGGVRDDLRRPDRRGSAGRHGRLDWRSACPPGRGRSTSPFMGIHDLPAPTTPGSRACDDVTVYGRSRERPCLHCGALCAAPRPAGAPALSWTSRMSRRREPPPRPDARMPEETAPTSKWRRFCPKFAPPRLLESLHCTAWACAGGALLGPASNWPRTPLRRHAVEPSEGHVRGSVETAVAAAEPASRAGRSVTVAAAARHSRRRRPLMPAARWRLRRRPPRCATLVLGPSRCSPWAKNP